MARSAALPDWPRLLSRDDAAAYVGGSPTVLREIGAVPLRFGNRVLYDRWDIDDRLNHRTGRGASAAPSAAEFLDLLDGPG